MFATVITDCRDDNALNRISTRVASLTQTSLSWVRVADDLKGQGELEAAGNLIDALDAAEGRKGMVLVNVAPRSGHAHGRWENGTPFGYFSYGETIVLTSIGNTTLSLIKKLQLVDSFHEISLEETVLEHLDQHSISTSADHIIHSQFRSFDFLPRAAVHILEGGEVSATEKSFEDIADTDNHVWWIDNFGNIKTTLLPGEITHGAGETVETSYGPLGYHYTLRDVPEGEVAIIAGSSGIKEKRFVEIVMQGGSAATKLNAKVGDTVLSS